MWACIHFCQGFFLYTVDKGTREGKNLSNNKESLKCGNNILLVMDEWPFSSKSSESSICPQISAAGAANRDLRGASNLPPLEDYCSAGQAMVWLWAPYPFQVSGSPQGTEASTESRALVAAWAVSLLSWSHQSTDLSFVEEKVFYIWKLTVRRALTFPLCRKTHREILCSKCFPYKFLMH